MVSSKLPTFLLNLLLAYLALSADLATAQSAGPQPSTLVYSYSSTGSMNPSLLSAASSAAGPFRSVADSSASDSLTGNGPIVFTTTPTKGSPTAPTQTGTQPFNSGNPAVVESSNTRDAFPTTGTGPIVSQNPSGTGVTVIPASDGYRTISSYWHSSTFWSASAMIAGSWIGGRWLLEGR